MTSFHWSLVIREQSIRGREVIKGAKWWRNGIGTDEYKVIVHVACIHMWTSNNPLAPLTGIHPLVHTVYSYICMCWTVYRGAHLAAGTAGTPGCGRKWSDRKRSGTVGTVRLLCGCPPQMRFGGALGGGDNLRGMAMHTMITSVHDHTKERWVMWSSMT